MTFWLLNCLLLAQAPSLLNYNGRDYYCTRGYSMKKTVGMMLLLLGLTGAAFAGTAGTPEIDASTAVSAMALLGGASLILRARKKR